MITFETAKKLKELGFPQDSYLGWNKGKIWKEGLPILFEQAKRDYLNSEFKEDYELIAAPTFEEILNELPRLKDYYFIVNFGSIGYYTSVGMQIYYKEEINNNITEAAAKLWIKLKKN